MPLWQPGPILSERPAYVRAADRAALDAQIALDNEGCPRVFEVTPNGEAALPIVEFLHDIQALMAPPWLQMDLREDQDSSNRRNKPDALFDLARRSPELDRAREYRIAKAVDCEYRALINAARDVLTGLHACNAAAVWRAAETMEAAATQLLQTGTPRCNPLTVAWARFLQVLADEVIARLEQGTTYEHPTPSPATKSWWKGRPDAAVGCDTALAALFPLATSPPGLKVKVWLGDVRVHLEAMRPAIGNPPAGAFEQASAWFTACAIRHFEQAHLGWAILFLHRAVDCLMMAKAAQLFFIDFSRHGGEYKAPQAALVGDARPSFSSSLRILSPPKWQFDLFQALNDWRNLLPYTHHMSVAQQTVAHKLIAEVVAVLPIYASSVAWVSATKVFARTAPLDLEDLLDPDGVLRSAVTPV